MRGCKIAKSDYLASSCLPVGLSARLSAWIVSHRTDFVKFDVLSIFRKPVEKTEV